MTETLLSKRETEVLVTNVKTRLFRVLQHPLLPELVPSQLCPKLENLKVLPDEDFESKLLQSATSEAPEARQMSQWIVKAINAAFTVDGEMILRLSYVQSDPMAKFFLQDLIAEELGHALRKEALVPLMAIEDGSLLIAPFPQKEDLLKDLEEARKKFKIGSLSPTEENIEVLIRGFESFFRDKITGKRYPRYWLQLAFEESRSAIIQTIIELLYGAICLLLILIQRNNTN